MSARNHSESSRDPVGPGPVPVLQPESRENHGLLEVVWSSPVITAAGTSTSGAVLPAGAEGSDERADRCVFAFESDLFDNALVHWDEEKGLTLEMIPGFKKDQAPYEVDSYPAESVSSALADLMTGTLSETISLVDPTMSSEGVTHFQPDATHAAAGPRRVREDGIEDPVKGWRPTGMVFFETLATPPRGTIYSSSLLDEFLSGHNGRNNKPGSGSPGSEPGSSYYHRSDHAPFFDFPEIVAPAPPDDTEDFPMEVVVRGGRRGGGGGIWIFRVFGKLLLVLLALLGVGCLALIGSYGLYIKQRLYDNERGRPVTVIVKPGDGFRTVINSLHQAGVLRGFMGLDDRYIMRYLAYAFENSDQIKPGVYRLDTGQNLQDVYDKLISGSKDFKLTIPEGKTAREVAEQVANNYTNFDVNRFMQLVNDPTYAKKLGIDAPSLEGYLYPSTYYFGPGMKEEELIQLMVSTFQGKVEDAKDKLTTTSLKFHEHVIMASLIEREARMDEDRPVIASVIFNRLEKGIPLQIDATVNFALNNWRRLTNADYKTDHPYNTYKIKGLPPGPIASPRIESLVATFQAPETNYLYYVHKGDGHHAFAETYPQHLANVGRYIREKNQSGMGNVPAGDSGPLVETTSESDKAPAVAGELKTSAEAAVEEEPAEDAEEGVEPAAGPKAKSDAAEKAEPKTKKPDTGDISESKTPGAKSY